MNATISPEWQSANYHYLMTSMEAGRQRLESRAAFLQNQPISSSVLEVESALKAAAAAMPTPSALQQLCTTFGLSNFERDVLLLCVGMELDLTFASLCADAMGQEQLSYPTFSLAMSAFSLANWNALAPHNPLRRWRLIEVGGGKTIATSPLRIDERVLHYLLGIDYLDERLRGIIELLSVSDYLVPSHQELAEKVAGIFSVGQDRASLPIVQLCGSSVDAKRSIAQAACTMLGMKLAVISVAAVPTVIAELNNIILLWEREARLNRLALLLDCDEFDSIEPAKESALAQLIANITSPLIITSHDRRRPHNRPLITFEVNPPTKQEQLAIWQNGLGSIAPSLNGQVEILVSQFNLSATTIYAVCTEVVGSKVRETVEQLPIPSLNMELWDSCRIQSRPQLDELAQRIEPAATWDDLILPEAQCQVLRDIAAHVRQRTLVYDKWGFAKKGGRGLGISALFAGASGTGKTMSAEVLAGVLRLDLYRIDLSSVVSKYIGETEKNLRRLFDAAEGGATILLFDEADSIFGKRSDVKDSHDRYANMEVSYLLQRIESYQGLAVLTTNLKDSIDTAFLRRIRFVVKYPFPDVKERALIWQRVFPIDTPTSGLDFAKLARLNVAGGNIRNIALNAAFLAADDGEAVQMKHLLSAARGEYIKLERSLTDAEVKGWV